MAKKDIIQLGKMVNNPSLTQKMIKLLNLIKNGNLINYLVINLKNLRPLISGFFDIYFND